MSTSGIPHADTLRFLELLATQTVRAIQARRTGSRAIKDGATVMGAGPIQLLGAVLARLKAEFLLVAMKAGCMRALDSCHFPDVVTFPPPLVAIGPPLVQVLVVPVADGASSGEALDSV